MGRGHPLPIYLHPIHSQPQALRSLKVLSTLATIVAEIVASVDET